MAYIGTLTGKQYETFEAMIHHERQEAMRRAPNDFGDAYKDVPLDTLKAICQDAQNIAEGSAVDRVRSNADVTVFLTLHPDYINNDFNRKLMEHEIGRNNPNLEELKAAYQSLRASGLLQLDQVEVVKQEQQAVNARAKQIRKNGITPKQYTEEQLYNMPLEDLRRLDAVENQRRMQRIAEEGGV